MPTAPPPHLQRGGAFSHKVPTGPRSPVGGGGVPALPPPRRVCRRGRAPEEMRGFLGAGEPCGILFGPERTGLVNDDIALADTVLMVPLNPAFSSLNLAQAVLIIGYEWFIARIEPPPEILHTGHSRPANKAELLRFFDHFDEALVLSGFLRHPDKRPSMTRNLRNLFQRAQCTEQELRTLHGVITAFLGPRKRDNTGIS